MSFSADLDLHVAILCSSIWQKNGQQIDAVLLTQLLCWTKSTQDSCFDFSQTICCRGHAYVQNARHIILNNVFFLEEDNLFYSP